MEPHPFSHNDEQYRIYADRPGEYLKVYNPDGSDFVPPMQNRYDQILRTKFGLNQNCFEALRNDRLPNWKITEVIIFGAAISIRHTTVYDKPVLKNDNICAFHGVRAEQSFTETIPYDNINRKNIDFVIKLMNENETKATWNVSISGEKVAIKTPSNMPYDFHRSRL